MSEQEHQSSQVQSSSDSHRWVSSLGDLARGLARVAVARRKALNWMGVERNIDTRRTMLLCATMAAAIIVACSAVLSSVGAADCGPSWSTVPSAPEFGVLRAIAAIAQDDVWILGWKTRGDEGITTGAEHWDGASWTLFPTPDGILESLSF